MYIGEDTSRNELLVGSGVPRLFCRRVMVGLCGVGRPLRLSEKWLIVPFHVGVVEADVVDVVVVMVGVVTVLAAVVVCSVGLHAKVSSALRLFIGLCRI